MGKVLDKYFQALRFGRGNLMDAYQRHQDKLSALEPHRGSTFYETKLREYEDEFQADKMRIRRDLVLKLTPIIDEMRTNVQKKVVRTPTPDQIATLQLLKLADHISPTEVQLYAQQMATSPLALRVLRQIAAEHHIFIGEPDTDVALARVAAMESAAVSFIEHYSGFDDPLAYDIVTRYMDLALRPDSEYRKNTDDIDSARKAEDLLLSRIIDSVDREQFEESAEVSSPSVKLHFDDIDALVDYIHSMTNCMDLNAAAVMTDEILACCPDQYGAAYRLFLATGEKAAINPEEEEPEADNSRFEKEYQTLRDRMNF